jgi:hypothetical protein
MKIAKYVKLCFVCLEPHEQFFSYLAAVTITIFQLSGGCHHYNFSAIWRLSPLPVTGLQI